MRRTYQFNGESYPVTVTQTGDRMFVEIDDHVYKVEHKQYHSGILQLHINGESFLVHTAIDNDTIHIQTNGVAKKLYRVARRSTDHNIPTQSADHDLSAPMPAQVTEILVQVGDTVVAGATLIILEAMKMELRITAPYDGQVESLAVNVSDMVERGQVLVELST